MPPLEIRKSKKEIILNQVLFLLSIKDSHFTADIPMNNQQFVSLSSPLLCSVIIREHSSSLKSDSFLEQMVQKFLNLWQNWISDFYFII
ncbi:hypothetical protein A9258_15375 [Aeromonas hydrophila]|nr:hypothetical protein A9258_15375 [Aeromonas hydrophila]